MNTPKNYTIALLCLSAIILATVVCLLYRTNTALGNPPDRGGDYLMLSGAYSDQLDLVYIIDRSQQKLNVYVLNLTDGDLVLRGQANLRLVFQRAARP